MIGKERQEAMAEPHEEPAQKLGLTPSDPRCRRFLSLCKDVFVEADASGIIRIISPAIEPITGQAPSDLLGKPLELLYAHPRAGRRFWKRLNRHGACTDFELALRHENGEAVSCLANGTVTREQETIVTLILRKVTDGEAAQRALRDSEALYRNLVEMAPDSIAVLDLKGRILSSNEAPCGISGYSLEEVRGKPFWEIGCFRLGDIPKYVKLFYALLRGRPAPPIEIECFSKDGTPQILESRVAIVKNGRRTVGLQVVSRNVTERKRAQQALQQAEERLRTVLDAAGIGWWYFNLDTGDLEVDQRCRELVNLPPDSQPGLEDLFGQLVDDDRRRVEQAYADASVRAGFYSVECRTLEEKGDSRWLLVKGRSILEPVGRRHIEGVVIDITDRKNTEEALRTSELKFRSVFENALDAMFLTKPDGTIAAANPAASSLFGMTEQELIEAGRDQLLDTADPAYAAGIEQRRRVGKVNTELTCIRQDGSRFRAEVSSVILPDQPVRAFAIIRDITERKQAEEALRESEARSRLLIETLPALAWRTSADGMHIECNQRWYEYTGQTPREVQAYGWLAAVHPDDLFRVAEVALRAGNLRQPYEVEYRLQRGSDGSFRWHLARALPSLGENGEVVSWIGSATDIEELKQAQEVLRRDRDEQLQRHREELAHVGRLSILGELAAGLAHELNQPLHAIANYARGCVLRLEKQPDTDEQLVAAMEQVSEEAHRAAEIVRRVRRFVEKRPPQFSPVSVNQLIEEVLRLQDVGQTEYDVRIELALAEDVPPALGDPIQIQQVLLNLIRNGVEAMEQTTPKSRVLTVKTAASDAEVCIAISDRGTGIAENARDKIFEPFFTSKPTGLGMGLAICRSIAQAHGGRLEVSGNEHQGATFRFFLPATPSDNS